MRQVTERKMNFFWGVGGGNGSEKLNPGAIRDH